MAKYLPLKYVTSSPMLHEGDQCWYTESTDNDNLQNEMHLQTDNTIH